MFQKKTTKINYRLSTTPGRYAGYSPYIGRLRRQHCNLQEVHQRSPESPLSYWDRSPWCLGHLSIPDSQCVWQDCYCVSHPRQGWQLWLEINNGASIWVVDKTGYGFWAQRLEDNERAILLGTGYAPCKTRSGGCDSWYVSALQVFCNPYPNHINSRLSSKFLVPTFRKRSIHAFSTSDTVKDQSRKGQRKVRVQLDQVIRLWRLPGKKCTIDLQRNMKLCGIRARFSPYYNKATKRITHSGIQLLPPTDFNVRMSCLYYTDSLDCATHYPGVYHSKVECT